VTALAVVSGGIREPSSTRLLADQLDVAVRSQLAPSSLPVTSTMIELRPLGRAIVDAMLTGFTSPELKSAFQILSDADGLIAVTPAFNASFSGLFKSFFDVLPEETLSGLPVLIAATGGTERHSLVLEHALRPMFSYLHAIVSPTGVYAATTDFGSHTGPSGLAERINTAASDFARLLQSCGARQQRDVFGEEVDEMTQLLTGAQPGNAAGQVED
jgi:FMN reductase